jgi:hypothetical protein
MMDKVGWRNLYLGRILLQMGKFNKFFGLNSFEKLLFLEAFLCLTWAKIILTVIPFKRILPLLKQKKQNTQKQINLKSIRESIYRASSATPWHSTCLMQSMAARRMLKRREIPSRMSIGMAKDENGDLVMHAWVESGDVEIVRNNTEYKELYVFD